MARISTSVPQNGSVLFEGRVAQIVDFDGSLVKLRFADGRDAGIALAEYIQHARAVRPDRGPGAAGTLPAIPWHPTGQRARQVRKMLNGYTAGRKAALHELDQRSS